MGKAQSKRSVDITTETKKGPDGGDEVTGKLEKIEDIDQKQVNGDASPQEKNDAAGEKKDAPDETENEKDLTTEKAAAENSATPPPANGSGGDQATESSPKEDGSGDAATAAEEQAKEGEEITPLADESLNKKSKKEKVKKKWSFRSISFGKKDKQKPAKTEGSDNAAAAAGTAINAENPATATTNGDASETVKTAENAAAGEESKKDETAGDTAKPVEVENGVASVKEQQMNGQKTPPTPTDEAVVEKKAPIETSTVVANETATTATAAVTTPAPVSTPTPAKNSIETNDSHSEMIKGTVDKIEAIVSNGTADAEKNGDVHEDEQKQQKHEEKTIAHSDDIIKTIPIDEKPHQNGTNGDDAAIEDLTAGTKALQIEVKTVHQIDNVNSTTTITTTNTTNSTSATTTTTTTTIPTTENFNSEQTTTTDTDTDKLLFITSVQTDKNIDTSTSTTNITNTSDKSLSSTKPIPLLSEEQTIVSHPEKVLDTEKESETEIEIEVAVEEPATASDPIQSIEDDAVTQQQIPPPLPLSAPPPQVCIFALKDNESRDNEISSIASDTTANDVVMESIDAKQSNALTDPLITEEVIEIIETTTMKEDDIASIETTTTEKTQHPFDDDEENNLCRTEEIECEFNDNSSTIIETITIGGISMADFISTYDEYHERMTESSNGVVNDDVVAAALEIVDQIQKDLEGEDDDSSQQEEIENDTSSNGLIDTSVEIRNEEIKTEVIEEAALQKTENEMISNPEDGLIEKLATLSLSHNIIELDIPQTTSALIVEEKIQHKIIIDPKNNEESEETTVEEQGNNHDQNNEKLIDEDQKMIETKATAEIEVCLLESESEPTTATATTQLNSNTTDVIIEEDDNDNNKVTITTMKMNAVIIDEKEEEENYVDHDEDENEKIVRSNKEMPNAKDLKENAAAAEITTQDLPVTCE